MMIFFSGSSRASLSGRIPIGRCGRGALRAAPGLAVGVEDRGQVGGRDPRPGAEGHRALDHALELADVARPVVSLQGVEGIAAEAQDVLAELLREPVAEMLGEQLDVGPAVPERGNHQADGADPVIELGAELPLLDQGGQVLAGGEDEPNAGASVVVGMAGRGFEVVDLQFAEELELDLGEEGPHFLEVQGPSAGLAELGRPVRQGGGTRLRDGPRILVGRARLGEPRAIEGDEGPIARVRRPGGAAGPGATCRSRARRRSGPRKGSGPGSRPARRSAACRGRR